MNFDPTLTEYYQLISDLTVNQLILYYFFAYFFTSVIRKILKQDIDLGLLGTLPSSANSTWHLKTLFTLVLIYFFKATLKTADSFLDLSNVGTLSIVVFVFVVLLLIIRILLEKTIFRGITRLKLRKIAEYDIAEHQKNNREAKIKVDALDNGVAHEFKNKKELWYKLTINIIVATILIIFSAQLNYLLAVITFIFAAVILKDNFADVKKSIDDNEQSKHGAYIEIIK